MATKNTMKNANYYDERLQQYLDDTNLRPPVRWRRVP